MGRPLLADEAVLMLDFIEARQLIHQTHRSLLLSVCKGLHAFLGVVVAGRVTENSRQRKVDGGHRRHVLLVGADDGRSQVDHHSRL